MINKIMLSIRKNNLDMFYSLIPHCNINTIDECEYGILHTAISREFDDVALYFIENIGDIDSGASF